jgi:Protein of unknown function (DUF1275)
MPSDTRPPDPWFSLGLSFVGGYGDAAGFVVAKAFTGHVTGSLVLATIAMAGHDWRMPTRSIETKSSKRKTFYAGSSPRIAPSRKEQIDLDRKATLPTQPAVFAARGAVEVPLSVPSQSMRFSSPRSKT